MLRNSTSLPPGAPLKLPMPEYCQYWPADRELLEARRIMAAVVPGGGGGLGVMVRRKPWLPVAFWYAPTTSPLALMPNAWCTVTPHDGHAARLMSSTAS